ncbi:MAG: tRNA (adenosine(37)-N6)-dimethylallyltransferase MiaA [Bacteroidia bacterium]
MKGPPFLLLISGPTGAGKTAISIEIYKRYGWPIISADSRQIYRYLDIGTNKVSQALQAEVPHFLIDICEPNEPYSAGRFVQAVESLLSRWSIPVVQIVGGTGFYMKALIQGLSPIPEVPREVRERAQVWMEAIGLSEAVRWLKEHDPATAEKIDLANPRRVLRAIEILWATGKSWSSFWTPSRGRRYKALQVVLSLPRFRLHEVIAQRTRQQVANGWLEETLFILEKGYSPDIPALQTLGYKECIQVLQGRLSQKDLLDRIIIANRQYARRQLTWWRSQRPDLWIENEPLYQRLAIIIEAVQKAIGTPI